MVMLFTDTSMLSLTKSKSWYVLQIRDHPSEVIVIGIHIHGIIQLTHNVFWVFEEGWAACNRHLATQHWRQQNACLVNNSWNMALASLILDGLFVFCYFTAVHSACNNYYPIRDNNDCALYYVCYQGYTYTYRCGNSYVYSTSARWCVSRSDWRNNCPTYGNTRTAVLNDQPSQGKI